MHVESAQRRPWGAGSVFRRYDGLWTFEIDLGRDRDGRRVRRKLYANTQAALERKVRDERLPYDRIATILRICELFRQGHDPRTSPELQAELAYQRFHERYERAAHESVQLARPRRRRARIKPRTRLASPDDLRLIGNMNGSPWQQGGPFTCKHGAMSLDFRMYWPAVPFDEWSASLAAGACAYLPASQVARTANGSVTIRYGIREVNLCVDDGAFYIRFFHDSVEQPALNMPDPLRNAFTVGNFAQTIAMFFDLRLASSKYAASVRLS